MRTVPETNNRQDWPRLVAQASNEAQNRIAALEAGGGGITRAKMRFVCG